MIPVRTNAGPPTVVHAFEQLPKTHPIARTWCAGCDLPLGDTNVALVYIGPGLTGPVQAGQWHSGAAVPVHALCAGVVVALTDAPVMQHATADFYTATYHPEGQPAVILALCASRVQAQQTCASDYENSRDQHLCGGCWSQVTSGVWSAVVPGGTYRVVASPQSHAEPQTGPVEGAENGT